MNAADLFYLLVFPGILFTVVLGFMVGWLDRKVSARFQFRVGPPLTQSFNDFFKLMGKETIVVRDGLHVTFIMAPFIAFGMLALVSTVIGSSLFFGEGFGADLIVVLYLLMIYSVMVVMGGTATGNIYPSIGAGREIKLLLADELVFILVCLIPVIKTGYSLRLGEILQWQSVNGAVAWSVSGFIGLILGIVCIQAKMALPPFHIPEAETELVEGPMMEYSGPPLAFWKLNHLMMYVIFPFLLILLFLGGFSVEGLGILWALLKYVLIVVLMVVIKNTNPRIRSDTALNFFWKYAAPAGFVALILSVIGG